MKEAGVLVFTACLVATIAVAGPFANLDFDQSDTSNPKGATVPLPGWTIYFGASQYGSPLLAGLVQLDGSADAVVLGGSDGGFGFAEVVQGRYALEFYRAGPTSPVWKLEQVGTVPVSSQFFAYRFLWNTMEIQINHEVVNPLFPPKQFGDQGYAYVATNVIYDVSRFAGQEVVLDFLGPFSTNQPAFSTQAAAAFIDTVQFLSSPPKLRFFESTNQVILSWDAAALGYGVQSAESLSPPVVWQNVSNTYTTSSQVQTVAVSIQGKSKFYRLAVSSGN